MEGNQMRETLKQHTGMPRQRAMPRGDPYDDDAATILKQASESRAKEFTGLAQ